MPACFSLSRKGSTEPVRLHTIDAELCEHFGVPVDSLEWFRNWYNIEGLGFALGYSFEELRERFADTPERLEVIDFLEKNFDVDAWTER